MSAMDTTRHFGNVTLPVNVTESVTRVADFVLTEHDVWWPWIVTDLLLRYGPVLCVSTATIGVALSTAVWIRLQRHLPATLLYLLIAMLLELLPVYMHCGSYVLKQVSLLT